MPKPNKTFVIFGVLAATFLICASTYHQQKQLDNEDDVFENMAPDTTHQDITDTGYKHGIEHVPPVQKTDSVPLLEK